MKPARTAPPARIPPPGRRRGRARQIVDGLLALAGLVIFVLGLPLVLLVVAPVTIPQSVPTWDQLQGALMSPDDGTVLLATLKWAVWAAWAWFSIGLLIELATAITRIRIPAIPLLGLTRAGAKSLLATAGLLLTTATPSVTSAPPAGASMELVLPERPPTLTGAANLSVSRPVARSTPAIQAAQRYAAPPRVFTPAEARLPVITVVRGDSLWGLAERHLGSGHRFGEIRALNAGHPQPGGLTLGDDGWLHPGWELLLPADATNLPAQSSVTAEGGAGSTSQATGQPVVHTVAPGDTLWDLAERHLGDGNRYPEVFALNVGIRQADGDALVLADLIRPGWKLTMPPTASAPVVAPAPSPSPVPAPASTPPAQSSPVTPDQASEATPPPQQDRRVPRSSSDVDPRSFAAREPNAEAVPDIAVAPGERGEAAAPAKDSTADSTFLDLFLGLTALAAAGIVGDVARRRVLQHHRRGVGDPITVPAPGSAAQAAERSIRGAPHPLTVAQVKDALLNLAARCYEDGRDLPRVAAILHTEDAIELILTTDETDPPITPFTATSPRQWRATVEDLAADPRLDQPNQCEPYPALVTLGVTSHAVVSINLEAAGTLTLTGTDDAVQDCLRALVTELATSDLAGRIGLLTDPTFASLAAVCSPDRIQIADGDALTAELDQRRSEITNTLEDNGVEDTLQARSDRFADDVWLPVVYVHTTDDRRQLSRSAPWSGSVAIRRSTTADGGWTLQIRDDGVARLEPLGIDLRPQRLAAGDLDRLVEVLRIANDTRPRIVREPNDTAELAHNVAALKANLARDAATSLPVPPTSATTGKTGLRICVLGPVAIEGLDARASSGISARMIELLAYLAISGPSSGPAIDEALWNGSRVEHQTRTSLMYRTRLRIGAQNLPVADADGIYRLGATVTCDWTEFHQLAMAGVDTWPDEADKLRAALDLVRNRPLHGIKGHQYVWADPPIQQMIATIADVAHVVSTHLLTAGDPRGASRAATKGLLAERSSELLHRDAINAALATGDRGEAERLADRLAATLAELDPDDAERADDLIASTREQRTG